MAESSPSPNDLGMDLDALLPIVVGAHPRAEAHDRPLAYRLRERVTVWLDKHGRGLNLTLQPLVLTDLWYMNRNDLPQRPTISIGDPSVNALSAYWAQNLPPAKEGQHRIVIQVDAEWVDLRVSLWGETPDLTVDAVEIFIRRHLDAYLRAVVTQVEPKDE